MPKLTFKYGAMGSTKTRELLATDYNFRQDCHLKSFVIKPATDDRDGFNVIKSRDGGERIADLVAYPDTNLYREAEKVMPDIVLVDEAQFLHEQQIIQLAEVVDILKIPVIAFGIKNDAFNNMFEGAKYLFLYGDAFEQIRTNCRLCRNAATMNMRVVNGAPVFTGEQVMTGGNDTYTPVCRSCYRRLKQANI